MVIQITFNNGTKDIHLWYRNTRCSLAQWRESFYSHRHTYKSGQLYKLRGTNKKLIAEF